MNAGVRVLRTGAEEAYSRAFSEAAPVLPGAHWVRSLRREAAERFESLGLPHRRVETWRWTDLRSILREVQPLAAPAAEPAEPRVLAGLDVHQLVFINGMFAPDLSSAPTTADIELTCLADLLSGPRDGLAEKLGTLAPLGEPVPLSLNAAFMQDGAVIRVPAGATVDKPIHLAFVFAGEPAAAYAHNLIVVERGAKVTLVESYEGPADSPYQVNAATELFVGDEAEVRHTRVQDEGLSSLHLGAFLAEIGANAKLESFAFVTGGGVSRHQIGVAFAGEGSTATISGVSLLKGRQHGDIALLVDHTVPHGDSRERFKVALDDEARGVFQGKIIVRRGAQKTDAKMAANALFLSDGAEFNGKPELEIFADDVQCGHGATAAEIDKDQVFYLKARGIPREEAEALLVRAYVAEALELVTDDAVRSALEERADVWLSGRRKEKTE